MSSSMRAKVFVSSIKQNAGPDGTVYSEQVTFRGVSAPKYDETGLDENNTFAKFSPAVEFNLTIANPHLIGKYERGETYYADFSLVEGETH